jgi:hypothetical protein
MEPWAYPGDRRRPSWHFVVGLLALTLGASGCIPLVPYVRQPGFRGSRSDLGDAVPEFIVVGQTTREEVLARLGHAEVEAPDGSWFYYQSHYLKSDSGLWAIPYGSSHFVEPWSMDSVVLARRLWVRFGSDGVVEEASFDRGECKDLDAAFIEAANRGKVDGQTNFCFACYPECLAEGTARPMIQRDLDMFALRASMRRSMAVADGSGELVLSWSRAQWRSKRATESLLFSSYLHASVNCSDHEGPREYGELLLSREFLLFLPHESSHAGVPSPPIRIARSSIAEAHVVAEGGSPGAAGPATELTLIDGSQVSFSICPRQYADFSTTRIDDERQTESAVTVRKRLREQLRATAP